MSDEMNPHLWIPNEEVIRIPHDPTGRKPLRDVEHAVHGENLLGELAEISNQHNRRQGALSDEIVVFKVSLVEKVHLHVRSTREFLEKSGITIHAVKNNSSAVVSTTHAKWGLLHDRLQRYTVRNSYADFQYVESFNTFEAEEKESEYLKRVTKRKKDDDALIDVQILLLPNLQDNQQDKVIKYLATQVEKQKGEIIAEPYYLHDGTPVIDALLSTSAITKISSEESVYRVMQTDFFDIGAPMDTVLNISNCGVDSSINPNDLPIVAVLDSGIELPQQLKPYLYAHWQAPGVGISNKKHGTAVAARVMFGLDLPSDTTHLLRPRSRVIDAQISDGSKLKPKELIDRIEAAVLRFKGECKTFNLSFNTETPIDGDEISIVAAEIDAISIRHGVQFVISAGNHHLWAYFDKLEDILDDDDSRIASPADSVLAITVGSFMTETIKGSMSEAFDISPFSRRGPGFAGTNKPDLVAPGGSLYSELIDGNYIGIPFDSKCAKILHPNGEIGLEVGTSFSAPLISGDFAQIHNMIPHGTPHSLLLAKALLIHATESLWDKENLDEDECEEILRYEGNGFANLQRALFSSNSSVSFVHTGTIDRITKERIKFFVPSILANQKGRNTSRITVTVVSQPDVDRTKGTEYCKSFVRASLKKNDGKGGLLAGNPDSTLGRDKWQAYQHFSRLFSRFNEGDWQIWLQAFTRWDTENDEPIPYALVVTVEDTAGQLDLYNQILQESNNRFQQLMPVRVRV